MKYKRLTIIADNNIAIRSIITPTPLFRRFHTQRHGTEKLFKQVLIHAFADSKRIVAFHGVDDLQACRPLAKEVSQQRIRKHLRKSTIN